MYIYEYIGLYICVDTFHLPFPYHFGSTKKVFCSGEPGREKNFSRPPPFYGLGALPPSGGVSSIDQISSVFSDRVISVVVEMTRTTFVRFMIDRPGFPGAATAEIDGLCSRILRRDHAQMGLVPAQVK